MSIQEEIRRKLAEMICGGDPSDGLYEFDVDNALEDVDKILKYLDSKGVVVATWHEGELYDGFERLVEE